VNDSGRDDGDTRLQLGDGWLRYHERQGSPPPEHEWALFAMQDLVLDDDPTECLAVIVDLVHASWNPWQRTMIGADPLESLVNSDGDRTLDAVDLAVGADSAFVRVLEAVWPGTRAATERVDAMLLRLGRGQTERKQKRTSGRDGDAHRTAR
jgi:hypothetical protein